MNIFMGLVVGFLCSEIIAGRKSKKRKQLLKSFLFKVKNNTIHIHHWVWSFLVLFILILTGYSSHSILGLFIGIFVQGLTYKNSFKIVYN